MTDLELVERAWRASLRTVEELAIFDSEGNFEYCVSGDEDSVSLNKLPLGAPSDWAGKVLTHYHTSLTLAFEHITRLNNPLSYADLRTAFKYGLKEIRAVCDNWLYSFCPSKVIYPSIFFDLCKRAGTTEDSTFAWEQTLVKLAELTGSKYQKTPFKEVYK